MVYILKSNKTLKSGNKVTYLYLAHNIHKNGMSVKEWMIPLGKQEDAAEKLKKIAKFQKSLFPCSGKCTSFSSPCKIVLPDQFPGEFVLVCNYS